MKVAQQFAIRWLVACKPVTGKLLLQVASAQVNYDPSGNANWISGNSCFCLIVKNIQNDYYHCTRNKVFH